MKLFLGILVLKFRIHGSTFKDMGINSLEYIKILVCIE